MEIWKGVSAADILYISHIPVPHIGIYAPNFLYFDLYFNIAYGAQNVYCNI